MNTQIFTLAKSDYIKSGIIFVLSAVLNALYQMLSDGALDYNKLLNVAVLATIAYLIKQLGTDEDGKTFGVKIN